uniref:DNA-directed RNA polymerase subunit beta' n=1 Tax=Chloromonas perforata TaxID=51730 RepID=A0A0S2LP47_9CHLO|nr:beta' subunit of RNA polymerase [Chloromonas perforata]
MIIYVKKNLLSCFDNKCSYHQISTYSSQRMKFGFWWFSPLKKGVFRTNPSFLSGKREGSFGSFSSFSSLGKVNNQPLSFGLSLLPPGDGDEESTSRGNKSFARKKGSIKEVKKEINKYYTSYSKLSEVKLLTIGIASPLRILQWAEKTLPNGKIYGEVLNANTLHHKTFKPQKGGLFCERIFGPLKDFECACGKIDKSSKQSQTFFMVAPPQESSKNKTNVEVNSSSKNPPLVPRKELLLPPLPCSNLDKEENKLLSTNPLLYTEEKNTPPNQGKQSHLSYSEGEPLLQVSETEKLVDTLPLCNEEPGYSSNEQKTFEKERGQTNINRKFCPDCDVEYTWSVIRRYQLGYIKLCSPVTHIWFLKGTPSYLSLLLDMKKRYLQFITYCSEILTIEKSSLPIYSVGNMLKSNSLPLLALSGDKKQELFFSQKQKNGDKKELQMKSPTSFLSEGYQYPYEGDTTSGYPRKEGNKQSKKLKKTPIPKKGWYSNRFQNHVFSVYHQREGGRSGDKKCFSSLSTTTRKNTLFLKNKVGNSLQISKAMETLPSILFLRLLLRQRLRTKEKFLVEKEGISIISILSLSVYCKNFTEALLGFCPGDATKGSSSFSGGENIQNWVLKTHSFTTTTKKGELHSQLQTEKSFTREAANVNNVLLKKLLSSETPKSFGYPPNFKNISKKMLEPIDLYILCLLERMLPKSSLTLSIQNTWEYIYKQAFIKAIKKAQFICTKKPALLCSETNEIPDALLNKWFTYLKSLALNEGEDQSMAISVPPEKQKLFFPFIVSPEDILSMIEDRSSWGCITFAPSLLGDISPSSGGNSLFTTGDKQGAGRVLPQEKKVIQHDKEIKKTHLVLKNLKIKYINHVFKLLENIKYPLVSLNYTTKFFLRVPSLLGDIPPLPPDEHFLKGKNAPDEQSKNRFSSLPPSTFGRESKVTLSLSSSGYPPLLKKGCITFFPLPKVDGIYPEIESYLLKNTTYIYRFLTKFFLNSFLLDFYLNIYSNKNLLFSPSWISGGYPTPGSPQRGNGGVTLAGKEREAGKEVKTGSFTLEKGEGDTPFFEFEKNCKVIPVYNRKIDQKNWITTTQSVLSTYKNFLKMKSASPYLCPSFQESKGKLLERFSKTSSKHLYIKERGKARKGTNSNTKNLYNNVYTLSHRERWDIEKDWQIFTLFTFGTTEYLDFPIYTYKNRLFSFINSVVEDYTGGYPKQLPQHNGGKSSFHHHKKKGVTSDEQTQKKQKSPFSLSSSFYSGAGIVQQLLNEFNFYEIKKLDTQNRLILYQLNKYILKLKKQVQIFVYDKTAQIELKELCKKRDLLIRRTKLVRKLFRKNSNPASMILTLIPVLPPDLRPIVKMGSQIAASDLNRLYQRVIYRNDRLKKFLKDPATSQSYEMKYAQRLLQEAVDNLLQNGKSGPNSEKDARGRALKSLSDVLKGKQGRFRQFLLGKRVDYSGRSVIVVGPKLKLHECGLPLEMAKELYLPFLLKSILNKNYAKTVVGAKTLIKNNSSLAHELLREIMQVSPVLLNRAPTLHRLGIQAFVPKLIEGRAILLHPLVCSAFNADFDGDQMAVHIPITVEARAEAWKIMLSRNNILSTATGDPLAIPSQDMVLGCYYLTTFSNHGKNLRGSGMYFNSLYDVIKVYEQRLIDVHSLVWVKWTNFIENGTDQEEPLEIRVSLFGQWQEITANYHRIYDSHNNLISQYICTTPGRILFNLIIQNTTLN